MTTAPYQCFFTQFGLRENPFHVSPNPHYYHATAEHDAATQEMLYGLRTRQGLLVLTGEAGTGKTTLLNTILDSLAKRRVSTAYVFHPLLETSELFEFILRDFGVKFTTSRKGDLLRILQEWLLFRDSVGDSPIVLIDEAQSLSVQTLDELRLLLNLETPRGKLLQIILAGQPELEEKLRRRELRQLRQRVMFHSRLSRLTTEQTAAYIQTRLSRAEFAETSPARPHSESSTLFAPDTLLCIHRHSRGIPRVINLLCEHALITAYGEQRQSISVDVIERIAADFDLVAEPLSVQTENEARGDSRRWSFPHLDEPLVERSKVEPQRLEASTVETRTDDSLAAQPSRAERPEDLSSTVPGLQSALSAAYLQAIDLGSPESSGVALADAVGASAGDAVPPAAAAVDTAQTPTATTESPVAAEDRELHPKQVAGPPPRPFWTPPHTPRTPRFVRHAWVAVFHYCQDVARSFVDDCRHFFKPLTSSGAGAARQAVDSPVSVDTPLSAPPRGRKRSPGNWLRQPMHSGRVAAAPAATRSASTK